MVDNIGHDTLEEMVEVGHANKAHVHVQGLRADSISSNIASESNIRVWKNDLNMMFGSLVLSISLAVIVRM